MIEDKVWIGCGAIILPGVTIGAGAGIKAHAVILHGVTVGADAVIAGGSIVSRDIPDRAYASGVPAVIRKIL